MRVSAKSSDLTADAQGLFESGVNHDSPKLSAPYVGEVSKIYKSLGR